MRMQQEKIVVFEKSSPSIIIYAGNSKSRVALMEDAASQNYPKILIVDDERGIRALISRYAGTLNYKTAECGSAEEVLALPDRSQYSIVITDIQMGKMNGLELTEKIRVTMPWAAVIIMTGFHSETAARKSRELGAVYYIRKPIARDELSKTLKLAAAWNTGVLIHSAAKRFLDLKRNDELELIPGRTMAVKLEIRRFLKESDSLAAVHQFVCQGAAAGNALLETLNEKFSARPVKT